MDLAKIRKKYQKLPSENSNVLIKSDINIVAPAMPSSEALTEASVFPKIDFFNNIVSSSATHVSGPAVIPEKNPEYRDPIEIILAGRRAAGCGEEYPDDKELSAGDVSEQCLEFLCFRVSDEIYGINIMDIKEIIKPREVTEIPRAPEFVSGIISLRGTIIPIIDMRSRLGLLRKSVTGKERVVVIKIDQSFSGLLVDEVIQVVSVDIENMEPAPSVLDGVDRDFVTGIGRSEGRLIIILNLVNIADIHLF